MRYKYLKDIKLLEYIHDQYAKDYHNGKLEDVGEDDLNKFSWIKIDMGYIADKLGTQGSYIDSRLRAYNMKYSEKRL